MASQETEVHAKWRLKQISRYPNAADDENYKMGSTIQFIKPSASLPTRSPHGLPIPLLGTRFCNFEAPMHSTHPSKGSLL